MTRKRFIKLMMAQGYSRNTATAAAMFARLQGLSYETACRPVQIYAALTKTIKVIVSGISSAVSSFFEALEEGLASEDNE